MYSDTVVCMNEYSSTRIICMEYVENSIVAQGFEKTTIWVQVFVLHNVDFLKYFATIHVDAFNDIVSTKYKQSVFSNKKLITLIIYCLIRLMENELRKLKRWEGRMKQQQ